ncbi:MAG: hypothetical protein ACI8RZ_003899 [Myxococcota bacterium]|jgi:hypothetical protein
MVTNIYRGSSAPSAVETLEFRSLGIEWVVRRASGERYTFNTLSRLRMALYDQTVTGDDDLSFNREMWRTIGEIPDLRSYFWMIWQRAQRGGLPGRSRTLVGDDAPAGFPSINDFDDEIPTRIVCAPPPVADAMQVTIPCFTEGVPKPVRHVLGVDDAGAAFGDTGFDEDGPTRIVGAFATRNMLLAAERPVVIPPATKPPMATLPPKATLHRSTVPAPAAEALLAVSPPTSRKIFRKIEMIALVAGGLTSLIAIVIFRALGLL